MFTVVYYKIYDNGFYVTETEDFDSFWQALAFASSLAMPYKVYKYFRWVGAVYCVARSVGVV